MIAGVSLHGQYASLTEFPFSEQIYKDPTNHIDYDLQQRFMKEIRKNSSWNRLIKNKRMSVGLVDLSDPFDIKYVSINGGNMMYAASLPKIAVLLASMDAIEKGELIETKEVKKDLRLMISKSNNAATTRMIERLGFDKISEVLTSDAYKLYDRDNGGGLWVGKKYAAAGRKKPDPIKGLSHAATVDQVCRFYTMLAYGKLVNPERSLEMLNYMGNPELHHKFVNTIERVDPSAEIFRKSGSWRNWHSDSALVVKEDGKTYILVALIEDATGGKICKDLVYAAEKALDKVVPNTIARVSKKRKIPTLTP